MKLNVSVSRLDEGLGALTVLEILCVRRMGKFAGCVARGSVRGRYHRPMRASRRCFRSGPPRARGSAAIKAAITQFTCVIALQYAWKGNGRTRFCRADEHADNSCPGVIAAYGDSAEEMARRRDEQCPMGRMGDAWHVAYAFNAVPTPFCRFCRRYFDAFETFLY